MTKKQWEKAGKIGYGENRYQYYSLDVKGYMICCADNLNIRFPTHINYDPNTQQLLLDFGNNTSLYKFKLLPEGEVARELTEKEKLAKEWGV